MMKYKIMFNINNTIRTKTVEADSRSKADGKLFEILRKKVIVYKAEVL